MVILRDYTKDYMLASQKSMLYMHRKVSERDSQQLSNPLERIMLASSKLQEKRFPKEQTARLLGIIQIASKTMSSIVNDTLDYNLIRKNKFKLKKSGFDLNEAV